LAAQASIFGCAFFAIVLSLSVGGEDSSLPRHTWSHILEHEALYPAITQLESQWFPALDRIFPDIASCCSSDVGLVKLPVLRNPSPKLSGQNYAQII
jgi:hypothetical protein